MDEWMNIRVERVDGGYGYGQCASHNLQSSYVKNTIDGFAEYVYSILSLPNLLGVDLGSYA